MPENTAPGDPPACTLLYCQSSEVLSQLFTGFGLLARGNFLDVRLRRTKRDWLNLSGAAMCAIVGTGCRIVYDTRDQARLNQDALEWCDFYFKRSFQKSWVPDSAGSKVIPLGFNYAVYARHDWRFHRMSATVLGALRDPVTAGRAIIDLSEVLSRLAGRPGGRSCCHVDAFEAPPSTNDTPRVLFLTRTWDPHSVRDDPALAEAWNSINRMRAGCIRALRRELGPAVVGGLAPTPDAVRDYPDCVVQDSRITKKRKYLELMKRSDVCVATKGLAGSNGWRLGEYVASSRAIVTEVLESEVPGDFAPGRNYSEFADPETCIEQTLVLVEDRERRLAMMEANRDYYNAYLRPDALVLNSLVRSGSITSS